MAIEKLTLHHVEGPRAGQSDSFRAGTVTVGRSPDTTLAFASERGVSSRHAEIRIEAERIELVDNNSTNGNATPLHRRTAPAPSVVSSEHELPESQHHLLRRNNRYWTPAGGGGPRQPQAHMRPDV